MLTHIRINNFNRLSEADIELGKSVVLIGPNTSGKTTALQALALWNIGLHRWYERRSGKSSPEERSGVTINRRDLIAIPVPVANLLWRDLHVRSIAERGSGKQRTQNVRIDIVVEGVTEGQPWECGLEFDYANEESLYCRPLRLNDDKPIQRMPVPTPAAAVKIAFLPPMSGLAAVEPKWEPGRINVLIGEGQTAQVLRNLCYQIYEQQQYWEMLVGQIKALFGVTLLEPHYIQERGEITMAYRDSNSIELDLSSSGRGLQQTVLLLAHLYANPQTVLLLDEPDAHLEVLRQRQIYQMLTQVAEAQGSQFIAASHSEVVLNEAAGRDIVIAFVGRPHRMDDRGSQVLKALNDIGFDQYYQAEQTGWVLYLEGSTDLAILQAFAATLNHPAVQILEQPFVSYVSTNLPQRARDHFYGLREAKPDLVGIALFDRIDKNLAADGPLAEMMWRRREIENYLCAEPVLIAYARQDQANDLFGFAEAEYRETVLRKCIAEVTNALEVLHKPGPWSEDIKASDDFLDPLFERYFSALQLPNLLRKTDYHVLARLVPPELIAPEVVEKLDVIVAVAQRAKPRV
ncbi:MAG: AAA family ATPase [Anaerolineae bacterium]|jgi:Fe-S cluster assembly ATPase SufC|nr:AAA family ATPase [Anaerolineae bacterium]